MLKFIEAERQIEKQIKSIELSGYKERYAFVLKYINPKDRILETSCGLGYGSFLISKKNPDSTVISVDSFYENIVYAKDNYQDKNNFFIYYDIEQVQHHANNYDKILSFQTLEQLDNLDSFLRNANIALKEDGMIILSFLNKDSSQLKASNKKYNTKYYTKAEVSKALESNGFSVSEILSQQDMDESPVEKGSDGELLIFVCKKLSAVYKPEEAEFKPLATVGISTMNRRVMLLKSFLCALNQTLKELEVLVLIDNKNTDDSPEWIAPYAMLDRRVTLIEGKDIDDKVKDGRGCGFNKNHIIDKAKAPYVSWLDDDDFLSENFMEVLVNSAYEHDADIAKSNFVVAQENSLNPPKYDNTKHVRKEVYQGGKQLYSLLWFGQTNTLFKRELSEKFNLRFTENSFFEDMEFVYGCHIKCKKLVYTKESRDVFYFCNRYESYDSITRAVDINKLITGYKDILNIIIKVTNMYAKEIKELKFSKNKIAIGMKSSFVDRHKRILSYIGVPDHVDIVTKKSGRRIFRVPILSVEDHNGLKTVKILNNIVYKEKRKKPNVKISYILGMPLIEERHKKQNLNIKVIKVCGLSIRKTDTIKDMFTPSYHMNCAKLHSTIYNMQGSDKTALAVNYDGNASIFANFHDNIHDLISLSKNYYYYPDNNMLNRIRYDNVILGVERGSNYNKIVSSAKPNTRFITAAKGFLSSITKDEETKFGTPNSFVFDDLGPHFSAVHPTRIELIINNSDNLSPEQEEKAKANIKIIKDNQLLQYNFGIPGEHLIVKNNKKNIFVVGQDFEDPSIYNSNVESTVFPDMLKAAKEENPGANIYVFNYKRHGINESDIDKDTTLINIPENISPAHFLAIADKVYTCSSNLGLDAVIRNKHVITFGTPCYAGWGLTEDRNDVFKSTEMQQRRSKKVTVEELFYRLYIQYSVYKIPGEQGSCSIEEAISNLISLKEEYFNTLEEATNENKNHKELKMVTI